MNQCKCPDNRYGRHIGLSLILLFEILIVLSYVNAAQAVMAAAYAPPSSVQIDVYELNGDGTKAGSLHRCKLGDTLYGCTARTNDSAWSYPYSSNSPFVPIEGEYLLNVVTKEVYVSAYHPYALEAIAAAARSYAYYHVRKGVVMNNSTDYQVFVPFAFENIIENAPVRPNQADRCMSTNLNQYQRKVCNAVARRIYVSYPDGGDNEAPAFTEYFADARNQTVTNPTAPYSNYLRGVSDPISSHPNLEPNGHGRGLSQNGASRWGYGNLSYAGTLDAWSTQFRFTEQILTHYYSNVTIRNANQGNQPTVPGTRWALLKVAWEATGSGSPPIMQPGVSYRVMVQVQNTSPLKWTCGYPFNGGVYLRYRLQRDGRPLYTGGSQAAVCGLDPGADSGQAPVLTIQLPGDWPRGTTSLRLDIDAPSTDSNLGCTFGAPAAASPTNYDLWFSQCGWPAYEISLCVGACLVQLPVVRKSSDIGWPTGQ